MRLIMLRALCMTLVLIAALETGAVATDTTLTANMNVDDAFSFYISTDDSVAGTFIGSGSAWWATDTFNVNLTPGVTNYLHIMASDVYGTIAMVIGDFSLSDANFQFANGTQTLLTDVTDWGVNLTGFGNPYSTPLSWGANGCCPQYWGTLGVDASAQFIWDPSECLYCTAYFSTPITPTDAPVPEPSTWLLFGSGLAGLAYWRRRQSA